MYQFSPPGITINHDRDMDYSTRYDDRHLIQTRTRNQRLDWLEEKIANEIMLSSHSIMKMERLRQRYYSDSIAAAEDNNTGYEMRYLDAIEHLRILIEEAYKQFPKVI